MDNAATECHCWIRHAIDPVHRQQISENLESFRRIGDTSGVWISMMQLTGACPARQITK